jgi:hypothetical protein
VDDWTLRGLQHGAVPKGTTPDLVFSNHVGGRLALTGFATRGYCSPVHTDPRDPRFTLGILFDKPSSELKSAGHFFFSDLQEASSDYVGVIVKQHTATIFLWQGKKFKHGSSIDHRGDKNISKTESQSIGMVIVQKPLLLRFSQKHKRETDRYKELERFHKFVRSRQNIERQKKII